MKAEEFLKKEGLLSKECTRFIINFPGGITVNLGELLEKFRDESTNHTN